ncbi:MAG TPA: anti-sigma factor antagonist [Spirochaetes bacterium]|nr:anti-sigma factor antagonist [Spirochaetota bacterium]
MELSTRKEGKVQIIQLEGRLDVHLSLEIEQAVNDLIDKGEKFLLFDLAGVQYLSSSGLRIFIAAMRRLKGVDGSLKLANMSESVKKIFKVVELIDLFEIYPSVEEATTAFGS